MANIKYPIANDVELKALQADYGGHKNETAKLVVGKNKFNKDTITAGKYINQVTGNTLDNPNHYTSDFISVFPSTSYTIHISHSQRIAFYDKDKLFLSSIFPVEDTSFVTPADAQYLRFSESPISKADSQQIELGTTSTAYEKFKMFIPSENLPLITLDVIPNGLITKEKLSFTTPTMTPTRNKFNKDAITVGKYVNQTNGYLYDNAGHAVSELIKVEPNTKYTLSTDLTGSLRIAWYDADMEFISGEWEPSLPLTSPSNASYIRFSDGISYISNSLLQFEEGEVSSPYVPYGYTLDGLYIPSTEGETALVINIPKKIYALVNQELNIYFENIIEGKTAEYDIDVVCSVGQHFERYYRVKPSMAGTWEFKLNVYKNNKLVSTATSSIIVTNSTVGSGVTKSIIVIGDSTTNNGIAITKLNENFSSDVMNIVTMGTRGSSPNQHEGRSGWTARQFVATPSTDDGTVVNAFYNPATERFDFSYYMSSTGFDKPDYVIINLGINDMFSPTTDDALETKIIEAIADYNIMINSIKEYDATIKIGIALTIPPNYSQDAFAKAYATGQTRWRYKRNNVLWVKKLIEVYDNREPENIFLVPINLNIDTKYNYGFETTPVNARNTSITEQTPIANGGVHPVDSGYWQIADSYWYWLKSFEV